MGAAAPNETRAMSKTFRHLYPQICDLAALIAAYRRARRGKRGRVDVASFELRFEDHLLDLRDALTDGSYRPGAYRSFTITESGKRRIISAAPFRDRIVHHALCAVLEPIWEPRFIHDSYACRQGKGTHAAIDRAQHFARGHRYVLQMDVQQFFPSIDHAILRAQLARYVADAPTLTLIDHVLAGGAATLRDSYQMMYFSGDDLFAVERPRGLPIGNQTSQFWANVYLDPLDHFIQRELGCRAYVRYCDDLLLFGDDRAALHRWRAAIIAYAAGLRLTMHERRAQVAPVHTGISFLGWRIFPYLRRLKRRNILAFARRFRTLQRRYAVGAIGLADIHAAVKGWRGHARHGQTAALTRSLIHRRPLVRLRGTP